MSALTPVPLPGSKVAPVHQPQSPAEDTVQQELVFHGVSLRLATVVAFMRIQQENKWLPTLSCCRSFKAREFKALYPHLKLIPNQQRLQICQRAINSVLLATAEAPHVLMSAGTAGTTLPRAFVIELLSSQRDNMTAKVLRCVRFYSSLAVRRYCPAKNYVEYVPLLIRKEVLEIAIELAIKDSLARIDRTRE